MTDHYFSAKPHAKSEEQEILANLRGLSFRFVTDAGVFSKKGIDFGSRLLIETVEVPAHSYVLDLGCGYGAIGIAIAKAVSGTRVVMVDVNERAVELALENARANQVADRTEILVSDGFEAIVDKQFDHVLFNPPIRAGKAVIYRLFSEAKQVLKPEGSLWIVIRKQQGAASAKRELESKYPVVEVVEQKKGYWVIRARNH